jgi:branched-chain amino acid transport system ATP-binding protein
MVVDHDLRLIMRVAGRIHALNEGRTLAEGTPEQVRKNEAVIQAYLGSEATHEALEAHQLDEGAPPIAQ